MGANGSLKIVAEGTDQELLMATRCCFDHSIPGRTANTLVVGSGTRLCIELSSETAACIDSETVYIDWATGDQ